MPAKYELLPRKEFKITLDDGTVIEGQFGTWFTKRMCDRRKLSYTEYTKLSGEQWSDPGMVSDALLSAVEHTARKHQQPFSFTDINACDWIDQLAHDVNSIANILMHQYDTAQLEMPKDSEKKTGNLNGVTLNDNSMQQAAV